MAIFDYDDYFRKKYGTAVRRNSAVGKLATCKGIHGVRMIDVWKLTPQTGKRLTIKKVQMQVQWGPPPHHQGQGIENETPIVGTIKLKDQILHCCHQQLKV